VTLIFSPFTPETYGQMELASVAFSSVPILS
jgi:hypothetical protein